jgi:hypothetical protein
LTRNIWSYDGGFRNVTHLVCYCTVFCLESDNSCPGILSAQADVEEKVIRLCAILKASKLREMYLLIFITSALYGLSDQLQSLLSSSSGKKSPRHLLRRRHCEPLSRAGLFLEKTSNLLGPKIEPRFTGRPARSTVTVQFTISRNMSVAYSTTLTTTHTQWSLPAILSRTNFSIIQGRVAT